MPSAHQLQCARCASDALRVAAAVPHALTCTVAHSYGGVSAGVDAGSSGTVDKAEAVAEEIRALGGEAVADGGNVAEFDEVKQMVAKATSQWDRLDITIVNAGIYRDRRIERVTEEDFDLTMAVHIKVRCPTLFCVFVTRASLVLRLAGSIRSTV